jgi:hypothetical protein
VDFFTDQNTAKNKNILKINPGKGTKYKKTSYHYHIKQTANGP